MSLVLNHNLVYAIFLCCLVVSALCGDSSQESQEDGHTDGPHHEGGHHQEGEGYLFKKEGILNSSSFPKTDNIKQVKLKECKLERISANTFSSMPKLKKIAIDHTTLGSLSEEVFKDCSNLKEIKIKHTKIDKFDPKAFANLAKLEELEIEDTNIGDLKGNMFSGCSKLEEFECDECGIENIEPGVFNGLTNLDKLHLQNNKIKTFSFADLPVMRKLKSISLSGNPLTNLDLTNIKEKCPNLKKIKLKGVNVQPEILEKLEKLNIKVKKGD